jgi:hypothetical protein
MPREAVAGTWHPLRLVYVQPPHRLRPPNLGTEPDLGPPAPPRTSAAAQRWLVAAPVAQGRPPTRSTIRARSPTAYAQLWHLKLRSVSMAAPH